MKGILLGILASFFFAFTFLLNRLMSVTGGSFIWSASLRYLFMIPLLLPVVYVQGGLHPLWQEMKLHPLRWILWSTVGFGFFYVPLCYAANNSPAWLVAGAWQFTIIAGSLLAPFFYENQPLVEKDERRRKRVPLRSLAFSGVIFIGIILMEWQHVMHVSLLSSVSGVLSVLLAAFAYPLGNRKMMELCEGRISAFERVLGMTIASLPLWIGLSIIGFYTAGRPSLTQVLQTFLVALFSGVIATGIFFAATEKAKGDNHYLAAVEATQSGEVIFTVIGGIWFLGEPMPHGLSLAGMGFLLVGMVLHSLFANRRTT
ncbi:DMT family transporter [Sulfoacidibacillus thermotolerans]|uniref:Multidrug resistance efflux transporter family protein n=1 Tax=Sulfoacidibacillus thermotolerans TaxID=1765684 RepID=A0A2U3DBW1_SULT2|nr:multidrug resistance efflux transporter family protein [Sulfoacidibacillus thermotolerans]PWI58771.1 hypothetical protein BM613_01365 [Sulfoacidibacillus thermotolerans]